MSKCYTIWYLPCDPFSKIHEKCVPKSKKFYIFFFFFALTEGNFFSFGKHFIGSLAHLMRSPGLGGAWGWDRWGLSYSAAIVLKASGHQDQLEGLWDSGGRIPASLTRFQVMLVWRPVLGTTARQNQAKRAFLGQIFFFFGCSRRFSVFLWPTENKRNLRRPRIQAAKNVT